MTKLLLISAALVLIGYAFGAVFNDNEVQLKCLPRRRFTYDHSICLCNDSGTEISCKREMNSTLKPELRQNQLQQITRDCTPGKIFNEQCQECICDKSGKYANCLRTGCTDEEAGTRDECIAGTVFADDCNACICGTDGKGVCTNLDCLLLSNTTESVTLCVPDSDLFFKCNDCSCSLNGKKIFCNKMGCGSLNFYHDSLLNVTIACAANTKFNYNCHQCQCDETGSYAMCSGTPCPHEYDFVKVVDTVDKCHPGKIFANDCNVCICNSDGKGTCTSLNCDISY